MGLVGVEFVVANTDAQSLARSAAERRVQLGMHLTQGLGAGAKPEIGRAAAEEAEEEIRRYLEGAQMAFITAGMGGGTGTGAAPVIARMARERGVLTVGVVTRPFDFEGPRRRHAAEEGLQELQQHVDTLIVVPNQNLFRAATERTTFAEAFKMADNVLHMGVRGVTDLMVPSVVGPRRCRCRGRRRAAGQCTCWSTALAYGCAVPANGWRRSMAASGAGPGRCSTLRRTPTPARSSPRC